VPPPVSEERSATGIRHSPYITTPAVDPELGALNVRFALLLILADPQLLPGPGVKISVTPIR